MRVTTHYQAGRRVAALVHRAWRGGGGTPRCAPTDIAGLCPLLVASGTAGLAWDVLKHTPAAAEAAPLREHHRRQGVANVAHEHGLAEAFTTLRAAGVEPLVFKGWAVGRRYPSPAMRAYGDADICVRPEQARRAAECLSGGAPRYPPVDLHVALSRRYGVSMETLFGRSVTVPLGDVPVRVPAPTDHLRLLCVHALRHGLDRPVWLCDVALLVEAEGMSVDWDTILATPRQAGWVRCVVRLAHEVLGADISSTPWASDRRPLPGWLVLALMAAWGREGPRSRQWAFSIAIGARGVGALVDELRRRWRNPIEATVEMGGPLNGLPRLPWQIAAYTGRALGLVRD